MRLSKKAQVSEQFNWIFVVIAGGVILLFFMFLIGNIMSASDAKLKATVITNFDAILTGAQVTPNSLNVIESTRSFGFDVTCDRDGLSDLSITDSSISIPLTNKIIYSPQTVQGEALFVYTIPIQRPFYIGNILLFTDPDTLFFIDTRGHSEVMEAYAAQFPSNITLVKGGIFQDYFKNYRHIVVVSLNPPLSLKDGVNDYGEDILKKKSVNWIYLEGSTAKMFSKSNKESTFDISNPGVVPLDGPEFIPLLTFSPDADFYQCNYKKLASQMRHISQVYESRAFRMAQDLDSRIDAGVSVKEVCITYYETAAAQFGVISNSDDPYKSESIAILESLNRQLLLASCPLVY